jgi:chromosome partitioning protein
VLVTSVVSLKGGVGKTSVVLGFASAAIRRGIDTLVVDLDPQSNATLTLDPAPGTATIADLLSDTGTSRVGRTVATTAWGDRLRLIPGSEDAERLNDPKPTARSLTRLRTALGRIRPEPELVLIDCPPSLGQLTRNGLVASQRAVLVTEPALFSVTGVQRALEAVQDERAHQPDLQPLGVVINKARARSSEQDYRITELRELFGPLVLSPTLPDRTAIQQAQGAGVPIHEWPSAGAREIAAAFDRLLDRLLRSVGQPAATVAS